MNQVQLRPATLDDMEMIFHWRNDPFILQRSTSPNPIRWEEHQSWFRRALSSPNYCLLIVQVDGTPIGQVRFDRKGAIAIISVYVVEQYTRKGHGVAAIEQATGQIFRVWRLRAVVACIREDNHPAQSAFARAGYAENGDMRTFCAPGHVTYAANAPAATSQEEAGGQQGFWRQSPARVLVIAAHPDDEILGCGGTMARLGKEGHNVRIIILGEGITSRYMQRAEADQNLLTSLRGHARCAAAELGVTNVELYDLPDNRFDTLPLLDVVKKVEDLIDAYNPDVIFTHHESDLNVDHQVTFRAVLTATRPIEGHPVRDLYAFEIASSTEWSFHQRAAFHPNVFFDISSTLEQKKRAMAHYESELREFPHPRSLHALEVIARRWGSVVGCQAAEAFQLVRSIRL